MSGLSDVLGTTVPTVAAPTEAYGPLQDPAAQKAYAQAQADYQTQMQNARAQIEAQVPDSGGGVDLVYGSYDNYINKLMESWQAANPAPTAAAVQASIDQQSARQNAQNEQQGFINSLQGQANGQGTSAVAEQAVAKGASAAQSGNVMPGQRAALIAGQAQAAPGQYAGVRLSEEQQAQSALGSALGLQANTYENITNQGLGISSNNLSAQEQTNQVNEAANAATAANTAGIESSVAQGVGGAATAAKGVGGAGPVPSDMRAKEDVQPVDNFRSRVGSALMALGGNAPAPALPASAGPFQRAGAALANPAVSAGNAPGVAPAPAGAGTPQPYGATNTNILPWAPMQTGIGSDVRAKDVMGALGRAPMQTNLVSNQPPLRYLDTETPTLSPKSMPSAGYMPGEAHLNPHLAAHVAAGNARPFAPGEYVRNPDGSWSSEVSMTVQDPSFNGGKATVIPSMWLKNGKPYIASNEDEAIDLARKSGLGWKGYSGIATADRAAVDRESAWQTIQRPEDASRIAPLYTASQSDVRAKDVMGALGRSADRTAAAIRGPVVDYPALASAAPMVSPEGSREGLAPVNGYEYRYKPEIAAALGKDTEPRAGIMAQELERSPYMHDAVSEGPGGLKMVDKERLLTGTAAAAAGLDKRVSMIEDALGRSSRDETDKIRGARVVYPELR